MRLVFLSCYLSVHQEPVCVKLYERLGQDFCYVATEPMRQERVEMGYPDLDSTYPFVIKAYENETQEKRARQLTLDADVVIFGSAPMNYIEERLKEGKLTFCGFERLYKTEVQRWKIPIHAIKLYMKYGRHRSLYLLCASAYTAADYARTHTFVNKAYKWGYFPEVKEYKSIDVLLSQKGTASIMWAGRFINWKHPEYVVEVAKRLREDGYEFHINLIGNGEKLTEIKNLIQQADLQEQVVFLGAMSPDQVRIHMEISQIYLFTSDRNEGWGAVLNESMNSGCAVVASDAIGAVPFLINDGKNGLVFRSGDVDDLYQKVKFLLDNPNECSSLGKNAYVTMMKLWNAEIAADRLLNLSQKLLQDEKHPYPYSEGPCSKAD